MTTLSKNLFTYRTSARRGQGTLAWRTGFLGIHDFEIQFFGQE